MKQISKSTLKYCKNYNNYKIINTKNIKNILNLFLSTILAIGKTIR